MFGRAVVLMKKCFGSFAAMAVSCACLMNCSLSSFAMDLNDCGTAFSGDAAENHKLANEWIDETKNGQNAQQTIWKNRDLSLTASGQQHSITHWEIGPKQETG